MSARSHTIGTFIQDIGHMGWGGVVLAGVPVRSGCCGKMFVIERSTLTPRGSIHEIQPPDFELSCPYCGERLPTESESGYLRDARPSYAD